MNRELTSLEVAGSTEGLVVAKGAVFDKVTHFINLNLVPSRADKLEKKSRNLVMEMQPWCREHEQIHRLVRMFLDVGSTSEDWLK